MSFVALLHPAFDAQGEPSGKWIELSPHLCIFIPDKTGTPAEAEELEQTCGKCGEALRTWPSRAPSFWYLSCPCVMVGFAKPVTREQITSIWESFRKVQAEVLGRDQQAGN